jgi:pimeloyl-ACP methyl ester carboxylesterase
MSQQTSTAREATIRREKRMRRRVKGAFWTFVALLVLLAICGAAYQAISDRRDRKRFPQMGRSVDIGGFSLNLNCSGEGQPTVILESGLGIPAAGWELVQPEIAKFARVCSYDRAGYGWSEAGPFPRTSLEIARELHALLTNARVAPPYIIVGHSFGGFTARVFNQLYPTGVAGVVFVDSSEEDQEQKMPRSLREVSAKETRQLRRMNAVIGFLIDFGLARAAMTRNMDEEKLPANLRDELVYLQLQPKFVKAILSEERSFAESANEVRASGTLGDKPVIVLTAGAGGEIPGVPAEDANQFFATWVGALQPRLTHLSTHGRQIILPNSHHLVPFEQPQSVVYGVKQVVHELEQRPE